MWIDVSICPMFGKRVRIKIWKEFIYIPNKQIFMMFLTLRSLPLDRGRRFRCYIVYYPVHLWNIINDPG